MGFFAPECEVDDEIRDSIVEWAHKYDPIAYMSQIICTDIVGHDDVKRGILYMLANQYADNPARRERIHILMAGEPGTGKSAVMDYISKEWNALYLSYDPSSASLKADARRKDGGEKLFATYDMGIIEIDEIDHMKDIEDLRDVMEMGKYSITKGGVHREYPARVSVVGGTNVIEGISAPVLSRFDLVYHFEVPSIEESVDIARSIVQSEADDGINVSNDSFTGMFFDCVRFYQPRIEHPAAYVSEVEKYLKRQGEGRSGRWLSSVHRIAKAIARLRLKDIGVLEIREALNVKHESDRVCWGA